MSSVPVPTCDHCPGPAATINGVTGRHCEDCAPHRFLPAGLAWFALSGFLSRAIDRAFDSVVVG